jgi:hypothetical protein
MTIIVRPHWPFKPVLWSSPAPATCKLDDQAEGVALCSIQVHFWVLTVMLQLFLAHDSSRRMNHPLVRLSGALQNGGDTGQSQYVPEREILVPLLVSSG